MNKYPFIEQLGLVVRKDFKKGINLLYADDLETLLEKAVKVTGYKDYDNDWCMGQWKDEGHDTHSALLINIQPLKPKCEIHIPLEDKSVTTCRTCGVDLYAEWKAVE